LLDVGFIAPYNQEMRSARKAENQEAAFEEVFTVSEYYDGPRQGTANMRGEPHFFDCIFSQEQDDYSDLYQLTPISRTALSLVLEDWSIFKRWETSFFAGATSRDTFAALPPDRMRSRELKQLLKPILATNPLTCFVKVGMFKVTPVVDLPVGVLRPLQVRWIDPTQTL
jgi:hypothetical protein